MRVLDLEYLISVFEDPPCRHCGMALDEHERIYTNKSGRLLRHHYFRCTGSGSYTEYGQDRTYYYE